MPRLLAIISGTVLILTAGFLFWPEPSITHAPGILCPDAPVQTEAADDEPVIEGDYTFTPLAAYEIRALVLSRKEYSDRGADVSPVDFALGWGPMSNQAVIDNFDITQTNRFYLWRSSRLPIPRDEITVSSANVHIIPANDAVREALDDVISGSIVSMKGQLVRVAGKDGFRWNSSLRRDDTGNGACELFRVEELLVENE